MAHIRISMSGVTWQMKGGESNDLIDKGADERQGSF